MAKTKRSATAESAVRRDLRTPLYRMRVARDKTKYDRKRDKRSFKEGFRKAIKLAFRKPSFIFCRTDLPVITPCKVLFL